MLAAVLPVERRTVCRVNRRVEARWVTDLEAVCPAAGASRCLTPSPGCFCSSQQRQLQLPVALTTGLAAALANPLVAEADVTPSLKNLLYSVVAGGTIAVIIAAAVTGVSNFDKTKRS